MQHLCVSDLKQRLSDGQNAPVLLDVREPWEFSICHIQGSQLIPMREIRYSVEQLDPGRETVVICHTGIRSQHVCHFLEQQGFDKVYNLWGGVHAWANEIDPNMPTY
jgi:rhodanese-related sulfurtransferase